MSSYRPICRAAHSRRRRQSGGGRGLDCSLYGGFIPTGGLFDPSARQTAVATSRSRGEQSGCSGGGIFPSGCLLQAKGTYYAKFKPAQDKDTANKNGVTYNIDTLHQCITSMTLYEHKSLEELRWEDYHHMGKRKTGQTESSQQVDTTMTTIQQQVSTMDLEGQHESQEDRSKPIKDEQVAARLKDKQIDTLKSELQRVTVRAEQAEKKVLELQRRLKHSSGQTTKLRELEDKLLETRVLNATSLADYEILCLIHDGGEEGLIVRVKCKSSSLSDKERIYAMKVLQTQDRKKLLEEYNVLCKLPSHNNIIHMWAFFYDHANPDIFSKFKSVTSINTDAQTMSLFLLMNDYITNMAEHVHMLVNNQGPNPVYILRWFRDLLCGLLFLENHRIVHRDLNTANLLLGEKGNLVISGFSKALVLNNGFTRQYTHDGTDIGGNRAHLSPEVLNAKCGPSATISYIKQPVWAAGVLAYELAGHSSPFSSDDIDQRHYFMTQVPPLTHTYCSNSMFNQPLSGKFTNLVHEMIDIKSSSRPSLTACHKTISALIH